jgi:hypothetical protein
MEIPGRIRARYVLQVLGGRNIMKITRVAANILGVAALAATFVLPGKTADTGALSYVSFNRPTEVPGGKVLPEGLYAFKVADANGSTKVVQIFLALQGGTLGTPSAYNANKPMTLSATVLAVPDYRTRAGGRNLLTFTGTPAAGPQVIKAFSPGPGADGLLALVFPQARAAELAKASKQPVPSMSSEPSADLAAMKSAALKAVNPDGQEVEVVAAFGAPGTPAAAAARGGQRGPEADPETGGAAIEAGPANAESRTQPQGVPVRGDVKGIDIMAAGKSVVLH